MNAGIAIKQRDVDRKSALVKNNAGSQLDLDNSATALVTARRSCKIVKQQHSTALNQLLGDPDLPLEHSRPKCGGQGGARRRRAQSRTPTVRAPMDGIATQVERIQLGRFVAAGTPVFSVIDTAASLGRGQSQGDRLHLCRRGQR